MKLAPYYEKLAQIETCRWTGTVTELVGLLVESSGPAAAIGDFCEIQTRDGRVIRTQVIGFRDGHVLSMPLEETDGLHLGDLMTARKEDARMEAGPELLGRVIDGFGKPLDGLGPIGARNPYQLYAPAPGPLEREPIGEPLVTGIRAIDSLLTCGKGQRIGIFGGSGVGKSTLLGAMAHYSSADVSVVALIGERNREVRDFIEHELGPDGLARSVLVVATSDRPAPLRIRAAFVALAVAEYFRDQGKSVLLVMDSVTRLAMAQREIGLAAGEPPSQKGYTPSVFNSASQDLRKIRALPERVHHGLLHGAGGGRRFQRTDLRRGARHPGRAHRALAPTRRLGPLPRHRRSAIGEPARAPALQRGTEGSGHQDPRSDGDAPTLGRPDQPGRLRQRSQSQAGCRAQAAAAS